MIAAVSRFAAAALTLVAFVAIALLYVAYGRPLVGLDGNMELAFWSIALWKSGGLIAESGSEAIKAITDAAGNDKAQRWIAIAAGVLVALAAGIYVAKTMGAV